MKIREINRKIKAIRRRIETKLYNYFNDIDNSKIKINPNEIKKILIINGSAIGNLVAYTPLIQTFKVYDENIQVDFVTEGASKDTLKHDKRISNIFSQIDIEKIRNEKHDLSIFIGDIGVKDHKFLKSINTKYYVGSTNKFKIFNLIVEDNDNEHISKMLDDITKNIFGISTENKYRVFFDENEKNRFKELIKTDKKIIVLNKYTSTEWKNFSNTDYIKLTKRFIQEGYFVIGIYPPKEKQNMVNLSKVINNENFYFLDKVNGILDSIHLISLADIVITADTSIVHIACGLNKPVIGIYITASFYEKWAPNSKNSIQIVYDRGPREGKKTPITGIDENFILQKINEMFENKINSLEIFNVKV